MKRLALLGAIVLSASLTTHGFRGDDDQAMRNALKAIWRAQSRHHESSGCYGGWDGLEIGVHPGEHDLVERHGYLFRIDLSRQADRWVCYAWPAEVGGLVAMIDRRGSIREAAGDGRYAGRGSAPEPGAAYPPGTVDLDGPLASRWGEAMSDGATWEHG